MRGRAAALLRLQVRNDERAKGEVMRARARACVRRQPISSQRQPHRRPRDLAAQHSIPHPRTPQIKQKPNKQRAAATATATATTTAPSTAAAATGAGAATTTSARAAAAAAGTSAPAPLLALPQLLRGLGAGALPPLPPPIAGADADAAADANNRRRSSSAASAAPAAAATSSIASPRLAHHHSHRRAFSSAAAAVAAPAASSAASASAAAAPLAANTQDDDDDDHDSQLVAAARRDPFALVADEVAAVGERMRRTVATEVPALADAALYFLRPGVTGKRLRPTLLLLMAGALEGEGATGGAATTSATTTKADDDPLSVDLRAPHEPCAPHETRRRQQRVAEVAELIHVASLLHDDVLDEASTRRGVPALHAATAVAAAATGASSSSSSSSSRRDKLAILAGDFLLARASVTLAALGDSRVVALLSRVLEHLVSGEVMQMSAKGEQLASPAHYLKKTYAKTASLMANSCRAVALIGGAQGGGDLAFEAARGGDGLGEGERDGRRSRDVWGEDEDDDDDDDDAGRAARRQQQQQPPLAPADAAWEYGRHLGMAFQVVDDLLDLTGAPGILGKPTLSDLRAGLATAPVLMAAEEDATGELRALATARFSGGERDVSRAVELVARTRGVERAWALARRHADAAADAVRALPPARTERARAHRAALVALTRRVLERRK
jgi:geranyl diphosphate synthase